MATTQKTFKPDKAYPTRNLTVTTNGGSVTLETIVEGAWQLTDTVTADGASQVFQGLQTVRVTPIGGAFYEYQ